MPCITSLRPFFFTAPAPPELYTLSLHDALPISRGAPAPAMCSERTRRPRSRRRGAPSGPSGSIRRTPDSTDRDRKSTRLNSSHVAISYAVFCLKKKKKTYNVIHEYHLPEILIL